MFPTGGIRTWLVDSGLVTSFEGVAFMGSDNV